MTESADLDVRDIDSFRKNFREEVLVLEGEVWRHFDTHAQGPILIMLPGAQGTAEVFWKQMMALGQQLRIIAINYPANSNVKVLANGLAAFLDGKGVGPVNVLGTSLGGYLAQTFALQYPERCLTVFLANSFADPTALQKKLRTPSEFAATSAATVLQEVLDRVAILPESDSSQTELKVFLRDQLENRQPPESLKSNFAAIAAAAPLPTLSNPASDIVLIDSDDDPVIPPETRSHLRQLYSGAEIVTLPKGGHILSVVQPTTYDEVICRRLLG